MDYFSFRRAGVLFHLINVGRAEILAGIAELRDAAGIADVSVMDDQVRGLVLEADGSAQVLGVAGDGEQSFRSGAE